MFTVKYIDEDGSENVCECARFTYDRKDGFGRVLIFDGVPDATGSNNVGCYAERREGEDGSISPRLYVMNSAGSTVASYTL